MVVARPIWGCPFLGLGRARGKLGYALIWRIIDASIDLSGHGHPCHPSLLSVVASRLAFSHCCSSHPRSSVMLRPIQYHHLPPSIIPTPHPISHGIAQAASSMASQSRQALRPLLYQLAPPRRPVGAAGRRRRPLSTSSTTTAAASPPTSATTAGVGGGAAAPEAAAAEEAGSWSRKVRTCVRWT